MIALAEDLNCTETGFTEQDAEICEHDGCLDRATELALFRADLLLHMDLAEAKEHMPEAFT